MPAKSQAGMGRIRRAIHKFGPALLLTLVSQVSSAAGLFVLQFLSARSADLYSVGIQVGYVALTSGVIGVTYNVALGRPAFNSWLSHSVLSCVLSISVGAATTLSVLKDQNPDDQLGTIALMATFALGGCALAVAGSRAVRLALNGKPKWLAGIAIVPNVAILVGLLFGFFMPDGTTSYLSGGVLWSISCFGLAFVLSRTGKLYEREVVDAPRVEAVSSQKRHTSFLAVGVLASALVPTLAIAAVTQLEAGSAALIFIVARIGTSVVGLGVNSILMVRYNWDSRTYVRPAVYCILLAAALAFILVAFVANLAAAAPAFSYVFIGLSWVCMLVAAAVIGREVNARRMTTTVAIKVVVDVVLALGAVGILWSHPSVTGYFGVFAMSQAVTVLICSIGLKHRAVSVLAAASMATALLSVVFGW